MVPVHGLSVLVKNTESRTTSISLIGCYPDERRLRYSFSGQVSRGGRETGHWEHEERGLAGTGRTRQEGVPSHSIILTF